MKIKKHTWSLLAVFFAFGIALSGCEARCVTCADCPSGVTLVSEEVCEDDFNSKEAFDQQIQLIEGYGCTCTEN